MKKIFNTYSSAFLLCLSTIGLCCCQEEMPANPLRFEHQEMVFASGLEEITIYLSLQRPAEGNIPVTLEMQTVGLTHGNELLVNPASIEVKGKIFLAFPRGVRQTSFSIRRLGSPLLSGKEKILLKITDTAAPAIIREPGMLLIHFEQKHRN